MRGVVRDPGVYLTDRLSEHGTGFSIRTLQDQVYCLDRMIIYNCETRIHRDASVYGESANHFVPER